MLPAQPRPPAARLAPRALALAALLGATLVAGCTAQSADPPAPLPATMTLVGLVTDPALTPLAGATVHVRDGPTATAGPDGTFTLPGLASTIHIAEAAAPGYANQTLTAVPATVGNRTEARLDFVLSPLPVLVPRNATLEFHGRVDCAADALIIPGSCDLVLEFTNDGLEPNGVGRPAPEPFEDAARFDFAADPGWRTLVVDVAYDGAAQPGFEGIRLTLQSPANQSALGTYEQYGRWSSPTSFSARIEPGQAYEDGIAPVPANATLFRLQFFPQGHGWHDVCVPFCTTGVGVGMNYEFEVVVTLFYVDPAPAGFTRLA